MKIDSWSLNIAFFIFPVNTFSIFLLIYGVQESISELVYFTFESKMNFLLVNLRNFFKFNNNKESLNIASYFDNKYL